MIVQHPKIPTMPDEARGVIIDLIDQATLTSAWEDALAGEDEPMTRAVTAACALVGIPVPGHPDNR